jgi:putative endonuclease
VADPRHLLGRRAEDSVATWLASRGWTVLARRWRAPTGELDIVAIDPSGVLVGIEVRARRSARAGSALESVDRRRLSRLRATLGVYAVQDRAPRAGIRLDLITASAQTDGWHLVRFPAVDGW